MPVWPQAGFRVLGLVLLLVAMWFVYDGWFIFAALGVSLLTGWLDALPRAIHALRTRPKATP